MCSILRHLSGLGKPTTAIWFLFGRSRRGAGCREASRTCRCFFGITKATYPIYAGKKLKAPPTRRVLTWRWPSLLRLLAGSTRCAGRAACGFGGVLAVSNTSEPLNLSDEKGISTSGRVFYCLLGSSRETQRKTHYTFWGGSPKNKHTEVEIPCTLINQGLVHPGHRPDTVLCKVRLM